MLRVRSPAALHMGAQLVVGALGMVGPCCEFRPGHAWTRHCFLFYVCAVGFCRCPHCESGGPHTWRAAGHRIARKQIHEKRRC